MPGVFDLANIYSQWISELSKFWEFLNMNLMVMLEQSMNHSVNEQAKAVFAALMAVLRVFNFQDDTLLTFVLSIAGTGFTVYFLWTMISYILDLLP